MSKIRLHGSSSGYTEIAPVAASGNNTLTLPNDGTIISKDSNGAVGVTSVHTTNITATGIATITTAKIGAGVTISESGIEASGIGITCANINGTQIGGRRNLIINGAMNVAQRGTSSTSTGYQTVDRFQVQFSGTDEAPTQAQVDLSSSDTPYTLGFRKSLKVTNGNQTSGAGAADYIGIEQRIEAQNIATSGWNYASPSSFVTFSFWVKSSVAQNFYGFLFTEDGAERIYSFETGSLSANTWTKITKTIPGNSIVQVNNDNGFGLQIYLWAFQGTNYTDSGATLNQWKVWDGADRFPDMTTTWYTTNDATFETTGWQLEVGSQATPFEHRSYGEEELLCHRYFFSGIAHRYWYNGHGGNVTDYQLIPFKTEMRAAPTIAFGTIHTSTNVNTGSGSDSGHFYSDVKASSWQYSPLSAATGNTTGKVDYTANAEI